MLLFQKPKAIVARGLRRATGAPSPLAGRTLLVTGASSGIGEEVAYAAGRAGARVIVVARRESELERVRAAVEAEGGVCDSYVCDLTDGIEVDELIVRVLKEHGSVDYLVNNAGRSIRRSLDLSYERFHDFERTMAVNYFGPVRLTMGLLPAMRAQKFGAVVNVVTWGVQVKAPKFAAYIASKTALDTFSRIAGREAFFDNVTFTNMRFSLVKTPMAAPTEAYAKMRGHTPAEAAALVVRALEDRPLTVNTKVADAVEVFNIVAPRASDFAMAVAHRLFKDSAAAKARVTPPED